MPSHTPGPWTSIYDVAEPTGEDAAGAMIEIPNYADTCLILAAPDLLAACEALLRVVAGEPEPTMADFDAAIAQGQAAIAKAKGESGD